MALMCVCVFFFKNNDKIKKNKKRGGHIIAKLKTKKIVKKKKRSIRAMYGMIIRGQYRFPTPHWDDISAEAVSCVKALMHLNPKERLTCDTLCTHPFILKHVSLEDIEKEETQLLQQQYTLMQSSLSQLLPQGVCRVPLDAALDISKSEQCHDDDDRLDEYRKQEKRERATTQIKQALFETVNFSNTY
ncbi:hypothetical protein RFI_05535 [Reticulomyxa filosa]|uniref:Protein kinase domain-containing protein n=1 Tax=Reticulomyxa filosa TaxID=46433 RepID=X6P0B7_RETFI|nr:hypothetical protein RFI_05535 [Reticulomyxa filosa]|eukprot:ETO31583.1 hypothetical protein RFI_05535 [Reticulomyxa filosa]